MKLEIMLYDRLVHLPTGRTGIYIEHTNVSKGYMVQAEDDKEPQVIIGEYKDFEKVKK